MSLAQLYAMQKKKRKKNIKSPKGNPPKKDAQKKINIILFLEKHKYDNIFIKLYRIFVSLIFIFL